MKRTMRRKVSMLLVSLTVLIAGFGFSMLQLNKSVEVYASTLSGFTMEETAAIRKQDPAGKLER